MSKIGKILIALAILVYIVSPIDAVPGPIDDLIVGLVGVAATKAISNKE